MSHASVTHHRGWDLLVAALRAGAALLLIALVINGVPRFGTGGALITTASTPEQALREEVASGASRSIVYVDSIPPTRVAAGLLAAAAARGRTVALRTPGLPPAVTAVPPPRPVARRRSALGVTVRTNVDGPIVLFVEDGLGQVDSVTIAAGRDGVTNTRIAVEPARAGPARWTIRASVGDVDIGSATASAWVRPEAPLRVLVLSGPPGWEMRFLIRALESAGIDLEVQQDLGRGLSVSSTGSTSAASIEDLQRFDVVVTSGGQGERATLLDTWVRSRGGGLLVVGGQTGTRRSVSAADLSWDGPAELVPLPLLDLEVNVETVPPTEGAVLIVGGNDSAPPMGTAGVGGQEAFATAAMVGRGRVVRWGLESWPWVMEAGAARAHERSWASIVAWLAGGLRDDVHVTGPSGQPWAMWEGEVEGALPPALLVETEGGPESLAIQAIDPMRGSVRFVPTTSGAHELGAAGTAPFAAALIEGGGERLTWADAALEIGREGGTVRADPRVAAIDDGPFASDDTWRRLLFLALAALVGLSWIVRRTRGLA